MAHYHWKKVSGFVFFCCQGGGGGGDLMPWDTWLKSISSGMEECKIPAWAKDKMFRHQQGAFSVPELQLLKKRFILISFCYSVWYNFKHIYSIAGYALLRLLFITSIPKLFSRKPYLCHVFDKHGKGMAANCSDLIPFHPPPLSVATSPLSLPPTLGYGGRRCIWQIAQAKRWSTSLQVGCSGEAL